MANVWALADDVHHNSVDIPPTRHRARIEFMHMVPPFNREVLRSTCAPRREHIRSGLSRSATSLENLDEEIEVDAGDKPVSTPPLDLRPHKPQRRQRRSTWNAFLPDIQKSLAASVVALARGHYRTPLRPERGPHLLRTV